MVFNNLLFLFLFLPILVALYQFIPGLLGKKIALFVCSLLFFAWGSPITLVLLMISIGWNYLTGLELELTEGSARKLSFIIGVVFNVFILVVYKYVNFFFGFLSIHLDLPLPVGLSFFTFSAISYLADVYMKKSQSQHNFLSLAIYISFFGKVTMGPIVQYHDMEKELESFQRLNNKVLGEASVRFLKGLAKKVILADQLSLMYTMLQSNHTMLATWLMAIAYMLQIYFDFSGYSDMAIGLSELFGFHFNENFDHPYMAVSVQDFWRRWHISLSRWFRDYIYIPLGGNRVSKTKYVRNIFVVWLLTGIWHGANFTFIVWGLYYGCLLLLERFVLKDHMDKWPMILRRVYTLFLVLIGWIFFFSPSLGSAFGTIGRLVGLGASGIMNYDVIFILKQYFITIVISVIFSTTIWNRIESIILYQFKQKGAYGLICFWIVLFLISISFVVASTFQSFLYFAF